MVAVVRMDVSPMNPKRWCLTLARGHEVWVTSERKPKLATVDACSTCRGKALRLAQK
jgi:hypothetical protein